MKKILNGKRYDTTKAKSIGSAQSMKTQSDSRYWEATLYITPRSKDFFIAGSGGPMSRFAQSVGQNVWAGGADLIPLTKSEAFHWAEQNLEIEEFVEYFQIEGD